MANMTDGQVSAIVSSLVKECESYRKELSVERLRATEYYDGVMKDVPAEDGHSKVISRDVRSAVKKVLPSIMRTILGNDKVVEYEPVGEGDEPQAEQATDYINYVVFPESQGHEAVQDAINDALKLRNGVIRWWHDKRVSVSVSRHTGLDEASLIQLVKDDDVTVLEQAQSVQTVETPQGPVQQPVYDIKIRRRTEDGRTRLAAVPGEEYLIHPDAMDIEESPIVGVNMRLRRSDLVAMGYDRTVIDGLPIATAGTGEDNDRRRDVSEGLDAAQKAMQEVEYYELYVRIDADDDGIAELRRLVFAGGTGEKNLLENEEWDEVPFADIVVERRPHQREGNSITDDMAEIQKIKTVLLRQTLDNLYWQNMPQPIVQEGQIVNPEAVLNPKFGEPIRVSTGVDVRAVLGYNNVPFVAKDSFAMLSYLNEEATDRTGISDASSGMAPDALQNMTAKATALIEQAGIGQTELMVQTIAKCLKPVFRGLLRMVIKHQDQPRTVRLRKEWVTYDPRSWNADMDATVNTGLGAGTRERDMAMMQIIMGIQDKLVAGLGPDNPFVKPDNVYNAVAKSVESAGIRSPEMYFTKPDPQEVQAKLEAQQNQPNPEMVKAQMQAQARQAEAQANAQLSQQKLEQEIALKKEQMDREFALKREQLTSELQLKREQNEAQMMLGVGRAVSTSTSAVHVGGEPG